MALELVVKRGSGAGHRFSVENEVTIGRAQGCDVVLDDKEVSRRHAVVRVRGAAAEVEDLGSTNGTFVNDQEIEGATGIGPGDVIRLGKTRLEIETDELAADPSESDGPASHTASTAPIRIDSGNVARWEPQPQPARTRELPEGSRFGGSRIGDRLGRLPLARIGGGVLAIVAIALIAAFLLRGGTTSKKDFVAAADKTCHKATLAARSFVPSHAATPRGMHRALDHLVAIRARGLERLRTMDLPEKTRPVKHFFAAAKQTNKALTRLEHATTIKKKALRRRRMAVARKAVVKAGATEKKIAHRYGFKRCGRVIGV